MSTPAASLAADELERRILWDRDGLVVVDKPWGIPSTGKTLTDPDSVQFALIQRHGEMTWAVHQLDADTSGLNLFVRHKALVPHWHQRMGFPNGRKTYLAVVHGELMVESQVIDAPIGVVNTDPITELGITEDGRPARSRVKVLDRARDCSLLRVQIETGRTHQIRIHLGFIGHPLFGERWYREPHCEAHPRQALHAWRLEFADAAEPRELESALPGDLADLLAARGLRLPPQSA